MDRVRQLILNRARDSGKNLSELSKAIGRNHAYLQQFVKRGVPAEIPEKIRPALAALLSVSELELRTPSVPKTVNYPKPLPERISPMPLHTIPGERLMGDYDLRVYSIVQGGRGVLVLSSEPYTHIARPHILLGLKDAYGVLVKGNSMAREFNEGDIAYVDPNRHPKDSQPCIFQSHKDDGTVEAMLKYLARSPDASDSLWYVEQSNPPKKFTIKKSEWQTCHVVVGKQAGY